MENEKIKITQESLNILLNPSSISKQNIWEINITKILQLLIKMLEQSDDKDLRIAGIAALSSSLIHKMKVESIFALHKSAIKKEMSVKKRKEMNIQLIDMPYRYESTYPVTLDELLNILEKLVGTIINPISKKNKLENIEAIPDFNEYLVTIENIIKEYEEIVLNKIKDSNIIYFSEIVNKLNSLETTRYFFAILFLAKDKKIELEQSYKDIKIINSKNKIKNE